MNPSPFHERRTMIHDDIAVRRTGARGALAHCDEILKRLDLLAAGDYRSSVDSIGATMSALAEDGLLMKAFAIRTARGVIPVRLTGAQSFAIYSGRNCMLRLNAWYPRTMCSSSAELEHSRYFSIGVCHNHNFDFFTTCVLGPGYESRFLRTHQDVQGLAEGDAIEFAETWTLQLGLGRSAFVPRDTDFHMQFYPESLSATINLIPYAGQSASGRQYTLEDGLRTVKRVVVCGPGQRADDRH
jgi:hypothetical protein